MAGTCLVQAFDASEVTMILAPCVVGAALVAVFVSPLDDRRLEPTDRPPPWSLRELLGSF